MINERYDASVLLSGLNDRDRAETFLIFLAMHASHYPAQW